MDGRSSMTDRNREINHVVCIMNNYKLTVFDLSGGGGGLGGLTFRCCFRFFSGRFFFVCVCVCVCQRGRNIF